MKKVSLRNNQDGLVAIVVTLLIITILGLTAVSFSKLITREARQTLDRQLSSQAFYAAESAVNEARQDIQTKLAAGNVSAAARTSCSQVTYDAATNTGYTCLLVTLDPPTIEADPVSVADTKVFPLFPPAGGGYYNQLNIEWANSGSNFANYVTTNLGDYPPANCSAPCSPWPADRFGVLRVDLIPIDNETVGSPAALNTRDELFARIRSFFLYPYDTSASLAFGSIQTGRTYGADCDNQKCRVSITGLTSDASISGYYIRLRAVYKPLSISISGSTNLQPVARFINAQAEIDATGRSQDLLRRIRVRVAISSVLDNTDFVLQTAGDICKRLLVEPNLTNTDILSSDSAFPECDPSQP